MVSIQENTQPPFSRNMWLSGIYMPGRIWCSNATLSPGIDHDPWPCAVTRERESTYKRTRRTDTARRRNTSDAGFTRGLFPAKRHPGRLARDLWPLRTFLEISNIVFSSTEREPLGWSCSLRAIGPSYPRDVHAIGPSLALGALRDGFLTLMTRHSIVSVTAAARADARGGTQDATMARWCSEEVVGCGDQDVS